MIFKSHMISMLIFAADRFHHAGLHQAQRPRHVRRYALKLFLYMAGGVIVFSWFMHFA